MTDPKNPELSRLGSDLEDIARGLREFSKSAEMLSNDRPRLINEHPSQWVGVYRGEVSAKADDLPSLMRSWRGGAFRSATRAFASSRRTSAH